MIREAAAELARKEAEAQEKVRKKALEPYLLTPYSLTLTP